MLSPTVGRRWLAQELRRLREAAGYKQADVAKRLRCNSTRIAHLESMRTLPSGPDLEVVLPYFGVPKERVEWYLQVCDLSRKKGWWDGNQAIPKWFSFYVGLEWGASEIHSWDTSLVQGLLQTRGYAEVIIRDGATVPEEVIQEQVQTRLRRQEALQRKENPLTLHAIMDEAALRRRVGNAEIMREQLQHLVTLNSHPRITIQVMPFEAGQHRGQLGSFKWLGFPQDGDDGLVYLENQHGGLYLEEPEELATFAADFAELRKRALSPKASVALIAKIVKELSE
ncbi:helix-turn-helix domain-containing protein [Goodfellowiella coeruleoviolacea]|nr:helix-turn-helix transcriptional regulator [Goodfellowiella coeruleoviolacea]